MRTNRSASARRFRGTRIPLLTDVLALLEGPAGSDAVRRDQAREPGALRSRPGGRARGRTRSGRWRGQCVVISFDLAAVHRARQLGGLPIGWVLSKYDAHSRMKYEALQPEYLFCDHKSLPQRRRAVARPVALGDLRESKPARLAHVAGRARRGLHRDHGGARDERGDPLGAPGRVTPGN